VYKRQVIFPGIMMKFELMEIPKSSRLYHWVVLDGFVFALGDRRMLLLLAVLVA